MAPTAQNGAAVAIVMGIALVFGAGVEFRQYLKVALPPMFFLLISLAVVAFSFNGLPTVTGEGLQQAARLGSRAVAAFSSLQFLALTTPMNQIIGILQQLRCPAMLLDIMVVSYRMLSVFADTIHDVRTAQTARMGYSTYQASIRSMGGILGNLAAQSLYRSTELHNAALARNNCGPLLFLETRYKNPVRDISISAIAGSIMLALVIFLR